MHKNEIRLDQATFSVLLTEASAMSEQHAEALYGQLGRQESEKEQKTESN